MVTRAEIDLVSFIVPAFNAESTLGATIASIRDAAAEFDHEIVIVDDGSIDATHDVAQALGDIVVKQACQAGAARVRNDAVRRASGDVFVFVDSDVTVTREAVAKLLAHVRGNADAAFGAYTSLPPVEVRNGATNFKNLLHHYTHLQGGVRTVSTFWSGFSAIRRDAFFAVHGFNPTVTWSADVEDIHLGYRLTQQSKRILLDPTAQVMHHKRYTLRRMVRSDLLHRAIPWTKAMLELRTFRSDLNLKGSSIAASIALAVALVSFALAPLLWPMAGAVVLLAIATWLLLSRRFIRYAVQECGVAGGAQATAYLALMNLYAPAGAAVGVLFFLLRGNHRSIRNTLSLELDSEERPYEVTVAVVLGDMDRAEAVAHLPAPASWWELLVVGHSEPDDLPENATFIEAPESFGSNAQAQLALEGAEGRMLALLSAKEVPAVGWLDRVRVAHARGDLAVGGAFEHDRRSHAARASSIVWNWRWRPEHPAMWLSDHPPTNCAFMVEPIRVMGGFRDRTAIFRRLSAYGVRPVRFDPAMLVHRAAGVPLQTKLDIARFGSVETASRVQYFDYTLPVRIANIVLTPVRYILGLVHLVGQAVEEGSADPAFFAVLPRVAWGLAWRELGSIDGFLRPGRHRPTLAPVARSEDPELAQLF